MSVSYLLPLVAGYLLGSIPFGLLITRAAGLGDIRSIGSGNIGATNVLRTGSKPLAAATLVLDALKATVAVLIAPDLLVMAQQAGGSAIAQADLVHAGVAGAYGAFLGHLYPVWLGFRGGKGVATYIGSLLGLFWPAALVFCGCWLAMAFAFRFSSLSALVSSVLAPIATVLAGRPDLAVAMAPLSLLLIFKHQANIRRLLSGEEPRIGQKA